MNKFRVYLNGTNAGVFEATSAEHAQVDAQRMAGIDVDAGYRIVDSLAYEIVAEQRVLERDSAGTPVHFFGEDGIEYDFR